MKNKKIGIGLFGFGVVGTAFYEAIRNNPGLNAEVVKVCVRSIDKKREIDAGPFTSFRHELLYNERIDVIVELTDDADAAFEIVKTAIENGKPVVSANKKMIAERLPELIQLQEEHGTPLLYEAACCAAVPVIRNLESYYDGENVREIKGVVNGSTNFILSAMRKNNSTFSSALNTAQKNGYAESNPFLDISGKDAVNKLSILTAHAFGNYINPEEVLHRGITSIDEQELQFASWTNTRIRLIAHSYREKDGVVSYVLPEFVPVDSPLYHVEQVDNGVEISGEYAGIHFFKGQGAGGNATAAAVISDLVALSRSFHYRYPKYKSSTADLKTTDVQLKVYVRMNSTFESELRHFSDEYFYRITENEIVIAGEICISKLSASQFFQSGKSSILILPDNIKWSEVSHQFELLECPTVQEVA